MKYSLKGMFLFVTVVVMAAIVLRQYLVVSKEPLLFFQQETGVELPYDASIIHDYEDVGDKFRLWRISIPQAYCSELLNQKPNFGPWRPGPVPISINSWVNKHLPVDLDAVKYSATEDTILQPLSGGHLLALDTDKCEAWYIRWPENRQESY